ncbi:homeobox-leucine zipper protein HDG2-like [Apium graveolens]|uniref:homeobox-leucine zipper protein HDG2-like n=1 Tax=Apium graveolens TaxID=4045 RepID=UPI003D798296
MVTPAKQSLDGEGSSALRFSTNVQEELGQNNSGGGQDDWDQGVVSAAAAEKALGKRKLEDIIDQQITDEQQQAAHIEANQGEEIARSELQDSRQQPEKHEAKIDKAPTSYNMEAIVELVRLATEELRVMAVVTEPLWRHCGADDGSRILDKVAYSRMFPNLVGPRQVGFTSEVSRETARIELSPKNLVSYFMDVSNWYVMFYEIVPKARTVDVLMNPEGATDYDGTLQVMAATYQLSTPLVPNRETYFARYCKRYSENDWIVVDVSLDGVHPVPVTGCKKRPSGCLIHELPDGFSQITWVEHVDADCRAIRAMYQPLLDSSIGFGAKRWISTLERRCRQMGNDISLKAPLGEYNQLVMSSDERAQTVLLKLAAKMVLNFNSGISGLTGNWKELSGHSTDDNIRVMTRMNMRDHSLPRGTLISAASSIWLPVPPKSVFDFLRNHNSGSEPLIPYPGREWEVLSGETAVEQVCHITKGHEASYSVSIHKVLAENSSQENILLLQESCSDPVASYIVFSRLRTEDMHLILNGISSQYRPLLPSGFAVHPDGPATGTEGSGGSLLTVSFQLLVDDSPTFVPPAEMHSQAADLINLTTERIKVAVEEFLSQAALLASMNEA